MERTRTNLMKIACVVVALAVAMLIACAATAPQQANAASTSTFGFDKGSVSKVKTSSKKIKILGKAFNTANYKQLSKGWYKYKINKKTKFKQVVNTETGKMKTVKKSKALKQLKKKKFITVYITFKNKGGVAKKVIFGV